MIDEGKALRKAIDRVRGGRKRWSCPPDLRSSLVAFAEKRQALGHGHRRVALDLGLSASAIIQWTRSGQGEFREVILQRKSSSTGIALVTPGGFRLDGLSEDFVLRLLREL